MLERGRVAERWRSERWDSLRLLSPNWMTRLPGWSYRGPDPHGFMTGDEVVSFFEGYARSSAAPVAEQTAVECLAADGRRLRVADERRALAGSQRGDRHRVVRPASCAAARPGSSIVRSTS